MIFKRKRKAPKVFCIEAGDNDKDRFLCRELWSHLTALERLGEITLWSLDEVLPGQNWAQQMKKHLYTSDIFLLPESPDAHKGSDRRQIQSTIAFRRRDWGEAYIMAIVLRPVLLDRLLLADVPLLPPTGKPITLYRNRDQGFLDTVKGIQETIRTQAWHDKKHFSRNSEWYEEKLASYEEAIHLNQKNADAYIDKAFALFMLRRYKEALASCEEAIHLDPEDATAYLSRGNIFWVLGNSGAAMNDFKQVHSLTGEWLGPNTPGPLIPLDPFWLKP